MHTLSERITHLENALLTQQNNCLLQLLNEIKAVPSQLCQLLLERFQVDGVAPLTRADMLEFAQQNNCLLMEKMTELLKQCQIELIGATYHHVHELKQATDQGCRENLTVKVT